jgi:hypothetical protein
MKYVGKWPWLGLAKGRHFEGNGGELLGHIYPALSPKPTPVRRRIFLKIFNL